MKPRTRNSAYYDETGRRRDGSPAQRKRTFTRAMWDSWWADRTPDERTEALRMGIDDTRRALSKHDTLCE